MAKGLLLTKKRMDTHLQENGLNTGNGIVELVYVHQSEFILMYITQPRKTKCKETMN